MFTHSTEEKLMINDTGSGIITKLSSKIVYTGKSLFPLLMLQFILHSSEQNIHEQSKSWLNWTLEKNNITSPEI